MSVNKLVKSKLIDRSVYYQIGNYLGGTILFLQAFILILLACAFASLFVCVCVHACVCLCVSHSYILSAINDY